MAAEALAKPAEQSASEAEWLRRENERLRAALAAYQNRLRARHGDAEAPAPSAPPAKEAAPALPLTSPYAHAAPEPSAPRLEASEEKHGAAHLSASVASAEGTADLMQRVADYIAQPQFLATLEESGGVVVANADSGDEVAFVEVGDEDWWTVVPDAADKRVEADALDGPWLVVEEADVVAAIAEFIAL
jgi:hypothetical protein